MKSTMLAGGVCLGAVAGALLALYVRSPDGQGHTLATEATSATHEVSSAASESLASAASAERIREAKTARLFSAMKSRNGLSRRSEIYEALQDLSRGDFGDLASRVQPLAERFRTSENDVLSLVLERWFEVDYDSARDWMRAHPEEWSGLAAWAKANPQLAMEEALATPDKSRSEWLFSQAIKHLGGGDPASQFQIILGLPPSPLRERGVSEILTAWASKDAAGALAALESAGSVKQFDQVRNQIIRKWAKQDGPAALGKVKSIIPKLTAGVFGNTLVTKVAGVIAAKNPRLALDWLSELPVEFRTAPAIAAARIWAAKEPTAGCPGLVPCKRDRSRAWQARCPECLADRCSR